MKVAKVLQVRWNENLVGTLALTADHKAAFEYNDDWMKKGFSISPFSLPLKKQVLYFFDEDEIVIATNGFVKKQQKTPRSEILLAKQRRAAYMARKETI